MMRTPADTMTQPNDADMPRGCPLCRGVPDPTVHAYAQCARFTGRELIVVHEYDSTFRVMTLSNWTAATVLHLRLFLEATLGVDVSQLLFVRNSYRERIDLDQADTTLADVGCLPGSFVFLSMNTDGAVALRAAIGVSADVAEDAACMRCDGAESMLMYAATQATAALLNPTPIAKPPTTAAAAELHPPSPAAIAAPQPPMQLPADFGRVLTVAVTGKRVARTVYIRDVPMTVDRATVVDRIKSFGTVLRIRYRNHDRPFTFIFVEYACEEDAHRCMSDAATRQWTIEGRCLRVQGARDAITNVDPCDAIRVVDARRVVEGRGALEDIALFDEGTDREVEVFECTFGQRGNRFKRLQVLDPFHLPAEAKPAATAVSAQVVVPPPPTVVPRTNPSPSARRIVEVATPPTASKQLNLRDPAATHDSAFKTTVASPGLMMGTVRRPSENLLDGLSSNLREQQSKVESDCAVQGPSHKGYNALRSITVFASYLYASNPTEGNGYRALDAAERTNRYLKGFVEHVRRGSLTIADRLVLLMANLCADALCIALMVNLNLAREATRMASAAVTAYPGTLGDLIDAASLPVTVDELNMLTTIAVLIEDINKESAVALLQVVHHRAAKLGDTHISLLLQAARNSRSLRDAFVPGVSNFTLAFICCHSKVTAFSMVSAVSNQTLVMPAAVPDAVLRSGMTIPEPSSPLTSRN